MRNRFLRKLKLIPTVTNMKQQGLVLQLNTTPDVFCIHKLPTPPIYDVHHNLAQLEIENDHKHVEEEEEEEAKVGCKETELAEEKLLVAHNNLSQTNKMMACKNEYPSLADFKEMCPPGGSHSIILYTTSLRGIRKTFQDCNTIRFLLRSFKIVYHERDVSLHMEYREELWKILGGKVIPPRLFIKGRYIGGADEVVGLHEMGWLGKFLEGTPTHSSDCPCIGCANMRFAICSNCCGSCKVFAGNGDNNDELFVRCSECNENGLVKCPLCC
ncbi:uncharacterized protein At5g39865-like [Abrus precatorius]|uniref:Uncharacterized protein At5g39865-like n=1 Tax=Abrus precatorius TaxID=3816 RepID=A0A8B8KZD2_ABRPR|nr:uncharacterized protein At5g39865-like [Abrus precatorius]